MEALYNLCNRQQWQVAITHIQSLVDGDQLFFQDDNGFTPIMFACRIYSAPLELVQLMITKAKLDSRKRCLLAITHVTGRAALRIAALWYHDPTVLKHPLELCATSSEGNTPLQYATRSRRPALILSILTRRHQRPRLPQLRRPRRQRQRRRARYLLGLHRHPRRPPRRPHDRPALHQARLRHRTETISLHVPLAFATLNDNVWSHIMTFPSFL